MSSKDEYNLLLPKDLFNAITKYRFDVCIEESTNLSFSKACAQLLEIGLEEVLYEEGAEDVA